MVDEPRQWLDADWHTRRSAVDDPTKHCPRRPLSLLVSGVEQPQQILLCCGHPLDGEGEVVLATLRGRNKTDQSLLVLSKSGLHNGWNGELRRQEEYLNGTTKPCIGYVCRCKH